MAALSLGNFVRKRSVPADIMRREKSEGGTEGGTKEAGGGVAFVGEIARCKKDLSWMALRGRHFVVDGNVRKPCCV